MKYWIDAKVDGTWLIILGNKSSAMLRLEAALPHPSIAATAVDELRSALLGIAPLVVDTEKGE